MLLETVSADCFTAVPPGRLSKVFILVFIPQSIIRTSMRWQFQVFTQHLHTHRFVLHRLGQPFRSWPGARRGWTRLDVCF